MTEFFTEQRDDGDTSSSSSRSECEETSKNQELLKKKTPERETVNEEDASVTIKYPSDLGMWPKVLSETDREYWIQTGSKDCQHSDSNFSKSTHFYEGETTPRTC